MSVRPRPSATRTRSAALALGVAIALALLAGGCSGDPEPRVGATTITNGGIDVAAIERGPADAETTVLFLHGQAYDSRIWDDRGILDAVADAGHRAVAVDLPGYGDTPDAPTDVAGSSIGDGTWLKGLVEELGGPERVVIVSPSMSGRYSLPYLEQHPDDALAGFVPVAPVDIEGYERPADAAGVPTLAVWGEGDDAFTTERTARLLEQSRAPDDSRTEVIAGASHAAYDDEPEAFADLLIGFLRDHEN